MVTLKQKFEQEIKWLKEQLKGPLSRKQRKEYEKQIRKKELEIAFNGDKVVWP